MHNTEPICAQSKINKELYLTCLFSQNLEIKFCTLCAAACSKKIAIYVTKTHACLISALPFEWINLDLRFKIVYFKV